MPATIKNPFRTAPARRLFDECIRSYNANNGGIRRNGLKCGNSMSNEFYRGYNHVIAPNRYSGKKYRTAEDRKLMGYVYWKAGEAVALFEQANQRANMKDDPRFDMAREEFYREQNNQ